VTINPNGTCQLASPPLFLMSLVSLVFLLDLPFIVSSDHLLKQIYNGKSSCEHILTQAAVNTVPHSHILFPPPGSGAKALSCVGILCRPRGSAEHKGDSNGEVVFCLGFDIVRFSVRAGRVVADGTFLSLGMKNSRRHKELAPVFLIFPSLAARPTSLSAVVAHECDSSLLKPGDGTHYKILGVLQFVFISGRGLLPGGNNIMKTQILRLKLRAQWRFVISSTCYHCSSFFLPQFAMLCGDFKRFPFTH